MKILKFILIIQIVLTGCAQHGIAEKGFVKRRELVKTFLEKKRAQKQKEDKIRTTLDIPYSEDLNPLKKLDVYSPKIKEDKLPVLIHIHGGGWKMGDKKNTEKHGVFYATRGILFISVNYRLSPEVQHPVHVQDCAEAVAWVFANLQDLGGDIDRIFISGHSAGAHLAALLGTDPQYLGKYGLSPDMFAGVIPVDTASFDLTAENNDKISKNFIRQAFGTAPEVLKSASPLNNISDKDSYPGFLIFASGNRESSMTQGKKLADKIKNVGGESEFIIVPNHTHGEMNQGMYDPSDPVARAILKTILDQKNQ